MTTPMQLAADAALALGRSPELSLILKATAILAAGLLVARMLRAGRASVRHVVLASTFAALLALPVSAAVMPEWRLTIPVQRPAGPAAIRTPAPGVSPTRAATSVVGASRMTPEDPAVPASFAGPARLAWAAGSATLLAWLAFGLWRLRHMRQHGLPSMALSPVAQTLAGQAGLSRPVALVTHERLVAPLTCGVLRPTIMLPPDAGEWTGAELHRALLHELEHARRLDWAVQILARVVCACYWFHPLAWIAWRQLRLEAERACDDAVVQNAETEDYAEQLVRLARRMGADAPRLSLAMASRSDLSRRVAALLDARQPRGRAGTGFVALAVTAAVAVLLLIAPVRAVEGGHTEDRSEITSLLMGLLHGDIEQGLASRQDVSLYRAATRGNIDRLTELIDAGANVNAVLPGDGSPLIGAARAGHHAAVKLLLDRGADPDLAVEGDGNPLIMAAREGHLEIVTLLLDRGAHVNQVVNGDETALIQASAEGRVAVVQRLLERKADVNIRVWADGAFDRPQGEWRTALSQARKGRHAAVVELLLAAGARE